MEKLTRFGVAMPEQLLEQFDRWIERTGLPNRSLAIRQLVRDYITSSHWQEGAGEVCGSITLMYDHHGNDITGGLTSLQHDFGDVIICTTHVHVSHEVCLECLVVKGEAGRLKKLEEALSALKGIRSVNAAIAASI